MGTEHPLKNMTCDVCHDEPMVGVASVPGVPMSVAYGRKCLNANAHPYDIVVANTAVATDNPDWRLGCADWWLQIVADTCAHLGKTSEQFDADVRAQMAAIAADDRAIHARWGYDEWCMVGPAGDVPGDWDG